MHGYNLELKLFIPDIYFHFAEKSGEKTISWIHSAGDFKTLCTTTKYFNNAKKRRRNEQQQDSVKQKKTVEKVKTENGNEEKSQNEN